MRRRHATMLACFIAIFADATPLLRRCQLLPRHCAASFDARYMLRELQDACAADFAAADAAYTLRHYAAAILCRRFRHG